MVSHGRKSYRLRFTSEQLKLVQRALFNYVKSLERSWNTSEDSAEAYQKLFSEKNMLQHPANSRRNQKNRETLQLCSLEARVKGG